MKKLITYFIQGLFYTVPLGITLYIVYTSIAFIDQLIPLKFPGMGLLTVLIIITLIGYLGSYVLASSVGSLLRKLEKIVLRVPGVKLIYTALKDLTSALMGTNKSFDHAVIVMLDKENDIEKIGFITKNDLSKLNIGPEKVSVYFPFSYGIMGDLKIVPKTSVKTIPGKSSEIMKFILSGGVVELSENIKQEDENE